MHYSVFAWVFLGLAFGGVNAAWHDREEKRCDGNNCVEMVKRQSGYDNGYSYGYSSVGYAQSSIIVPAASADYYSSSAIASASAYPSYSSYYPYSSYVASSYGPQMSQAPNRPQPSRPHSGGGHPRPQGGSNGGHNAAQSSSAPNQPTKPNAASSISSKKGGALLAVGLLTGVVALVL